MTSKKVDWEVYDRSLKKRGCITFWMSDETTENWYSELTSKRGAQPKIETALSLRLVLCVVA